MTEKNTNIVYVDLGPEALTDGKWFDGLAVGEFTDMWGSELEIKSEDLDPFVDNTLAGILATETESGEIVGIPIDSRNHDRGDAAGWIVDARRKGDKIELLPKWTEIGVDLISKGIMRFFSATFNLKQKVIVGGTLTNWPATRDEKETILLKPIELSQGVTAYTSAIDSDLPDEVTPPEADANQGDIEQPNKENDMVDFDKLSDEQRADLMAEAKEAVLAELVPDAHEGGEDPIAALRQKLDLSAFSELANVQEISDALNAQMEAVLVDQLQRVEAQAGRRLAQMMAEMKRKSEIAEFCDRATGGTDEAPRGLPIASNDLEAFMLSLDEKQRPAAQELFGQILDSGLIDFSEKGHGREIEGTKELPAGVDRLLKRHMDNGGELAEFFEVADIGNMKDYNLSAYKE